MTNARPQTDDGKLIAPNRNSAPTAATPFTGSGFETFSDILVGQVCNALWTANSTPEDRQSQMQACLGAMAGIGPGDEVEGMLAVQMVMLHNAAMECSRRAMVKDQPFQSRQMNLNYAAKLSRTFALHMEALDRHRGKGQQTVRVEHVTVNAGGQAIVGTVHAGVGGADKLEEQAHANVIAHAPEPAMRSTFAADREAVPEWRDG